MGDTATRSDDRTKDHGLKRVIGPALLFFFILGDMLGGGIYALVGEVAGEVGGAVWSAFIGAFVLAALTAFAYAELVTKYPRAAGSALYVNLAFKNPFVTFVVAFVVMASGITSAAALAIGFAGDYFSEFISAPVTLVALLFLVVVALVNSYGIGESVKANAVFTVIEVSGLILIVVIGVAALGDGGGGDYDFARNFEWSGDGSPLVLALGGAALAFYALIGFEDSVNVAEEVRNPSRAYPIALFGGLVTAAIVYLLVTMAASTVVPVEQLAESGDLLAVVENGPLDISTRLFSGIALFALANGALINMIMASRLVYGMAEEGIVPSIFSSTLPGRQTPWVAILFTTALAFVLVFTGQESVGLLASVTVMLLLAVFIMVNVACLMLRSDEVDHDHFTAPTFVPVLGALVSAGLITQNEGAVFLRAGILVVVGVVLWFVTKATTDVSGDIDVTNLGD